MKIRIYFLLGCLFAFIGFVGIFVPLLPTTPFLLLAAFCFQTGSPRLHAWLLGHPRWGPGIRDWQNHGVIGKRAKIMATLLMTVSLSYPLFFKVFALWLKGTAVFVCGMVLIFIWSRPSAAPVDRNLTSPL